MSGAGPNIGEMTDDFADDAHDREVARKLDEEIECGYSDLHAMLRSGLHCWWQNRRLNPNYRPSQSKEMDAGSIAHKMLLGRGREIVEIDADDWRTKAAKEARDAAYAENKTPILARKLPAILKMVETAKAYIARSEIAGVLDTGVAEETIRWKENGTPCRGTPDWLNRDMRIILDYKSTGGSADPDAFLRQVVPMGYDIQATHYLRAVGTNFSFIWLVQENEEPFACSLCAMSPAMDDLAYRRWEYAMGCWRHAIKTNEWRGYPSRIAYLEPQAWDVARLEELIELGTQA